MRLSSSSSSSVQYTPRPVSCSPFVLQSLAPAARQFAGNVVRGEGGGISGVILMHAYWKRKIWKLFFLFNFTNKRIDFAVIFEEYLR